MPSVGERERYEPAANAAFRLAAEELSFERSEHP
jgi:hypothetical protein